MLRYKNYLAQLLYFKSFHFLSYAELGDLLGFTRQNIHSIFTGLYGKMGSHESYKAIEELIPCDFTFDEYASQFRVLADEYELSDKFIAEQLGMSPLEVGNVLNKKNRGHMSTYMKLEEFFEGVLKCTKI